MARLYSASDGPPRRGELSSPLPKVMLLTSSRVLGCAEVHGCVILC
jgi:hypothetical protein